MENNYVDSLPQQKNAVANFNELTLPKPTTSTTNSAATADDGDRRVPVDHYQTNNCQYGGKTSSENKFTSSELTKHC